MKSMTLTPKIRTAKTVLYTVTATILLASSLSVQAQNTANAANPVVPQMPESKSGQCLALVYTPAKLGETIAEVTATSAAEHLEMVPAKYQWVEKKVVVKEEEKRLEIIPATYKTIKEKVLVEPERVEYEIIPAQFEEQTEKVQTKPAMKVWRRASGGALSITGEVMRSIDMPAEYKTISKKVMVKAPEVRERIIPPIYAEVEKEVIEKPAETREVVLPAEFKTIRVSEAVESAQEVRQPIAEEKQKITQYELLSDAEVTWQRVPCESDLNEENIKTMQKSLRKAGLEVSVDGKFGKGTLEIIEKFQKKQGIATGALTIETMKALGVNID